jgi:Glycosyl hydrolases family 43
MRRFAGSHPDSADENMADQEEMMQAQIRAARAVLAVLIAALASAVTVVTVAQVATTIPAAASFGGYWTPLYSENFADPTVLEVGGSYVAYATQSGQESVPTATSSDGVNWTAGPNAMPSVPSWATAGFTWGPSVAQDAAGQYVMFFAALDTATNLECIGRATAPSPSGPFVDAESVPDICQGSLGGSIDPDIFTDTDGQSSLIWKSNGNAAGQPTHLWSQPMDADLALTGTPTMLLSDDETWQHGVVEGPAMVRANGAYYLFYSGGYFRTSDYGIGYAICAGPSGPCTDQPGPILDSQPGEQGPGGPSFFTENGQLEMAFAAWANAVGIRNGGERAMYVAAVSFGEGSVPILTPANMVPYEKGYWLAASDGGIFSFGNAPFFGSMGGQPLDQPLDQPIVGIAATADDEGYWEVAADGGIFSFGDASFFGSMGGRPLNAPIVGMTVDPATGGYWEVASDGGIFSFGNAPFFGSMGGHSLNQPIVGMAATPDGGGYWEVAADGGIFSFGDASFLGSMGGRPLNAPIVGMAVDPATGGYWEVAADGGLFSFGNVAFYGSMGGLPLDQPIVGMAATPDGRGYWEVASDGGIFSFGEAEFWGSTGGFTLDAPIVAMANAN